MRKDLFIQIQMKIIEDSINNTIRKISSKAKKKYLKGLEGRGSEHYDRTGDIEDALDNPPYVKLNNSNKKVKIVWFDENYIEAAIADSKKKFNHHMSFGKRSQKSNVMMWQEDGYHVFKKPVDGILFLEESITEVCGTMNWRTFISEEINQEILDEFLLMASEIQKGMR